MPQIVNTNVASLNAQRNLNRSQDMLSTSLERISSGLRVNSAKDDAAGLAISNRLQAQVRGFNQAARNAADAVSLAQTGEGSLAEVTNNLQRMREIAVQSRNATNTDADRKSLDQEFQQLLSENDRIAQTTTFNGRTVLDGTIGTAVFQVGSNVGETISVELGASSSMRTNAIGGITTQTLTLLGHDGTGGQGVLDGVSGDNFADVTPDESFALGAGELELNGIAVGAATAGTNGQGAGSAFAIAAAFNAMTPSTGVTAVANATTMSISAAEFDAALTFTDAGAGATLVYKLQINGVDVVTQGETPTITKQSDLITHINAVSATSGVVATLQSDNSITLTADDGRNIEFVEELTGATTNEADLVVGFKNATIGDGDAETHMTKSFTNKGSISLSSGADILLKDVNAQENFFAEIAQNATETFDAKTVNVSDVLTIGNSDDAILRIDQAISDVDSLRGTFGAMQSRFESTIRNLQTSSENASAANSRIMDADFAEETAALTRAQILQQAGVSILAQANLLPQNALALLQ